ncbi:MAG: AAA family ATPase [Gammaproteobacteria bacterium]|nr:AAA family ATPase [Gammaproteobacteria bacterium]
MKSLGNVGRELWLTWSQTSPRWEPDDARRWDTFEGSSTGYQSIFAEAQRLGWVNPRSREAQPITARSGPADHEQRQGQQPPPALWPDPVDVRELLSGTPMPPRMIIDDWLPCGYATLFAGHGGAGKSSTALHLAVCIATGREFFGLHCSMRRVMYLSCEDRADVLHWRLSRICAHDGVDPGDLAGFNLFDLVGADTILYRKELMTGAGVTGVYRELERRMTETRSEVLFVDGVSDAYGGSENDRGEVKQFVNSLVRLIGTSGAVVLIHHVNRQSAASGVTSEGYSGSTGWHNSVRARWYLYPETERTDEGITTTGDLVLALQKSNLGRDDQSLRLRWDDAAHMFLAEEAPSRFDVEDREEAEQEGIVRALREVVQSGDYVPAAQQGQRTAYHVLAATESLPESLKLPSARKRFWRHIEKTASQSNCPRGEMRRANRHVVATLELVSPKNGANVNASDSDKDIRRITAQDAPAPNAPYSAGGYRGCARAQSPCRRCDGEGCPHCAGGTS